MNNRQRSAIVVVNNAGVNRVARETDVTGYAAMGRDWNAFREWAATVPRQGAVADHPVGSRAGSRVK